MKEGRTGRTVFPIALLAERRRCVVVGGGKVAAHKVALLLDGGAEVTVVSPELGETLAGLVGAGRVTHVQRTFEPDDLQDALIVFAATDNKDANAAVLDACRERGVLCCRVDSGWRDGDFMTPAIVRSGDLTVSVSTGGRSCRQARDVKNALREWLANVPSSTDS
jgi:precorrin-2 dehydrogenase / sirohydrochlorin ferrochelatase